MLVYLECKLFEKFKNRNKKKKQLNKTKRIKNFIKNKIYGIDCSVTYHAFSAILYNHQTSLCLSIICISIYMTWLN